MDKRSERFSKNCASVKKVFLSLEELCAGRSAPSKLLDACSSQGALANFEDAEASIFALSLNTFKKCADSSVAGGFVKVDSLRRELLSRSSIIEPPPKPSISDDYDAAQRLRVVLIRAHLELMELAKEFSHGNRNHRQRLADHHRKYRAFFGPAPIGD